MSAPQIQIVDDPARDCADAILAAVAAGGDVVLTGGSTPKRAYELAAQQPDRLTGGTFWFGDERCVGPEDERSNYRMVRETMLDPLAAAGVEDVRCFRMRGELGHEAGAGAYARELEEHASRPFELLLLGIGPDGHVASLFPGQDTLEVRDRDVIGVPEAGFEPYVPRISFTFPVLGNARRVLVLATGEGKAEPVGRAFGDGARPSRDTPASMLAEFCENLTVLLDTAAASRL